MHAKSLQSCPTLHNPVACSLPGSSVHRTLRARILEWIAISFSNIRLRLCMITTLNWSIPQTQDLKLPRKFTEKKMQMLGKNACDQHLRPAPPRSAIHSFAHSLVLWKVKMVVTQLCPTLCNSMDCSRPGSSLHGILQARILGGVAIPFSRGSSPGIEPGSPVLQADSFTVWATREAPFYWRPTMWQDLCWTLTPWWKIQPCPPKLVLSEEEKIGKWC